MVELGEYLDTHPGDARAAELFRSNSGLYAQAAAAWEAENGPIVQRSAVGESGYDWLRGRGRGSTLQTTGRADDVCL